MKNVNKHFAVLASLFIFLQVNTLAQDTMRNVNRPTTKSDSASYSDTSFLNNSIRQLIVEFQLAEMGQQNAERPKMKQLARDIMANDREALERLLALAGDKPISGVKQQDLDNIRKSMTTNRSSGSGGTNERRFTGNTATDSLGSGKTGSGNLKGEDTSTLRASRGADTDRDDTQAPYMYDSEEFDRDLAGIGNTRGTEFEHKWLDMMHKLQNWKIIQYNKAADITKDDSIRAAALALIPRAKLDLETMKRLIKNAGPSRSVDPNTQKRAGDDRINRKYAK